jgi:hypothetical protein
MKAFVIIIEDILYQMTDEGSCQQRWCLTPKFINVLNRGFPPLSYSPLGEVSP